MLFPDLRGKKFGYVNLNLEAQRWFLDCDFPTKPNPLLDPEICEQMILEVHAKYDLDFSYGGWLEDRSDLWRGSYLDQEQIYIHLGVDFNVPAGTRVAASQKMKVLIVDSDYPAEGGWGNRVIAESDELGVFIYAHLDNDVLCKPGDVLEQGAVFAKVGSAPQNGGWFPHLHVQCVDQTYFKQLTQDDLSKLDGYGSKNEIADLARRFKDPLSFLSLT